MFSLSRVSFNEVANCGGVVGNDFAAGGGGPKGFQRGMFRQIITSRGLGNRFRELGGMRGCQANHRIIEFVELFRHADARGRVRVQQIAEFFMEALDGRQGMGGVRRAGHDFGIHLAEARAGQFHAYVRGKLGHLRGQNIG